MLGVRHPLYFPILMYTDDGVILPRGQGESPPSAKRPRRPLYLLSWGEQEARLYHRHMAWAVKHHAGKDVPFISTLPQPWNDHVKKTVFAIDPAYMREIRWHTHQAMEAWNRHAPFSGHLRDWCREPAVHHVVASFKLLADCMYLTETKNYADMSAKMFLERAMMYKFWQYQTALGQVWQRSWMDKVEGAVGSGDFMPPDLSEAKSLVETLRAHLEERNEQLVRLGELGLEEDDPDGLPEAPPIHVSLDKIADRVVCHLQVPSGGGSDTVETTVHELLMNGLAPFMRAIRHAAGDLAPQLDRGVVADIIAARVEEMRSRFGGAMAGS